MLRLKELRNQKGYTQKQLAIKLGVSQSTLSSWETEKTQMDYASIISSAKLLNVTVDYLLGYSNDTSNWVSIPVLGPTAKDMPENNIERIAEKYEIPVEYLEDDSCFGVVVKGDSLEPRIRSGYILIVQLTDQLENESVMVITVDDSYSSVVRIKSEGTNIICQPLNPEYEAAVFDRNETDRIKIVGKVIEFIGKV